MMPYILLAFASLLIVTSVFVAYEIGRRVGEYETRRAYRFPNYKTKTESRK